MEEAAFISYHFQTDSILKLGSQSVLEVGVGSGVTAAYLRNCGVKVTTCDFDPSVHPDIVADVLAIPVPDKSYDAAVAFQILEHIPFGEFGKALDELMRISSKNVVISLPYRSSYFEWVIKIPGIRTLLKRNFIDLTLRWPLRFGGFETSGQHHWEIDSGKYKLSRVKEEIRKHARILDEFSPPLNKFHYFFVLGPL